MSARAQNRVAVRVSERALAPPRTRHSRERRVRPLTFSDGRVRDHRTRPGELPRPGSSWRTSVDDATTFTPAACIRIGDPVSRIAVRRNHDTHAAGNSVGLGILLGRACKHHPGRSLSGKIRGRSKAPAAATMCRARIRQSRSRNTPSGIEPQKPRLAPARLRAHTRVRGRKRRTPGSGQDPHAGSPTAAMGPRSRPRAPSESSADGGTLRRGTRVSRPSSRGDDRRAQSGDPTAHDQDVRCGRDLPRIDRDPFSGGAPTRPYGVSPARTDARSAT